MKRSKSTLKALWVSLLCFVLCCSLFIGTTFAWFTDSAATGSNRIVAGNLDIALNYMKDGAWVDASTAEKGELFKTDSPWEPGKVVYEEFQVENKGSLAAKYFLSFTDVAYNIVLMAAEEEGKYVSSEWAYSLVDVLQVGFYNGTIDELKDDLGLTAEDDFDRTAVERAVEEGLISFYEELDDFIYYNAISGDTKAYGALAPAGDYIGEEGVSDGGLEPIESLSWVDPYKTDFEGNPIVYNFENVTDTAEYTIFLYWEPGFSILGYEFEEDFSDDTWNLNNGKAASLQSADEYNTQAELEWIAGGHSDPDDSENYIDFSEWTTQYYKVDKEMTTDSLVIDFSVYVEATQIAHESDGFGSDYDNEVDFPEEDMPVMPPLIEP